MCDSTEDHRQDDRSGIHSADPNVGRVVDGVRCKEACSYTNRVIRHAVCQTSEKKHRTQFHSSDTMSDLTALLFASADGDDHAFSLVIHAVYSDLERLTLASMLRQFGGRLDRLTLMPGDLLHEAMLRLMKERAAARSRQEFFAIAATLISQVIVDYQRRRLAAKRGGRAGRGVSLDHSDRPEVGRQAEPDAGLELLEKLQREMDAMIHDDPRAAEVLAMRAWGRFRRAEIIEMTGMNPTEVDRAWRRGCERIEKALAD